MKYIENFNGPKIVLAAGIAAIDCTTLVEAARATEPDMPGGYVALPSQANIGSSAAFQDLVEIIVVDSLSVVAKIDTKKMTWEEQHHPKRAVLRNYVGTESRAVEFSSVEVAYIDGVPAACVYLRLYDDRQACMWFAEPPIDVMQNVGYYELFAYARTLSEKFVHAQAEMYQHAQVPAMQIDYTRQLDEIVQMNPGLIRVEQQFKVAIDETGARVIAETEMSRSGPMLPSSSWKEMITFGEKNPVLFWLTEADVEGSVPFAVVLSTAEAWLSPNQEVSFDL